MKPSKYNTTYRTFLRSFEVKTFVIILLTITMLQSCKSKKTYTSKKSTTKTVITDPNLTISKQAKAIVNYAETFKGTRYKYGGTTKKGMDCSGLVVTSFEKFDISLPRTTKDLSTTGNWIDLKKVSVGDLVFFATKKNSRKINHVGIVTDVRPGNVQFIHASSSKGVMISSIAERYWYFAFVQARRIL